MSLLDAACQTCSVCWKTRTAGHPRIYAIGDPDARILFIDDMPHMFSKDWSEWWTITSYKDFYWEKIRWVQEACAYLVDGLPFTYTQAVRCEPEVLSDSDINPAVACGVWTHNLTANRSLIITGKQGFGQMKLDTEKYEDYKMYRSARLGIIFTIPATPTYVKDGHLEEIHTRLSRALKEARLK